MHRGDAAQRGVASGSLPRALALRWTYRAGGAIASSPVVAEGRVFFGSDDQRVHAVELASGESAWSFATEDIVEAPPLYYAGVVYVGSSDFRLYALDAATGELRWKAETDDKIVGGANVAVMSDGSARIVVGSYDTKLYGFDAKSGELRWTYETGNYVNGTPAVSGERIVFGGCDSVLHVVSAATGEALAKLELCPDCHVAGSVALEGDAAYFGHYGNAFVRASIASSKIVWAFEGRQAFFSSPAIATDRVVFGGRDKRLHCVRKEDGEELWSFPVRRKVDGSPVICGDAVVFGSADGRLYVLALEDGAERWSYEIGQPILSSPAVVDGTVLIGANDGGLYAFGAAKESSEEEGK